SCNDVHPFPWLHSLKSCCSLSLNTATSDGNRSSAKRRITRRGTPRGSSGRGGSRHLRNISFIWRPLSRARFFHAMSPSFETRRPRFIPSRRISGRRAIAALAGSHQQRIPLALGSALALLLCAVAFLKLGSALLTSHRASTPASKHRKPRDWVAGLVSPTA